jgi:hypothetical protein
MKKGSWMSLWMVAFSVAGIASLIRQQGPWDQRYYRLTWFDWGVAILALVTIGMIGLLQVWSPANLDERKLNLVRVSEAYRNAAISIVRQRWILLLFGIVGLVRVVGAACETALYHAAGYGASARGMEQMSRPFSLSSLTDPLAAALHNTLARPTILFPSCLPHIGLSRSAGDMSLLCILMLALTAIMWPRLRVLQAEPEYEAQARLAPLVTLPITIAAIGAVAFSIEMLYAIMSGRMRQPPAGYMAVNAATMIVTDLFYAVVKGFLFGGLVGSLVRIARNEATNNNTFFRDAIRYFAPVAVIFLIVSLPDWLRPAVDPTVSLRAASLASIILFLQKLCMLGLPLLMLAPYAAVVHNTGWFESIRKGVNDWLSYAWDAVVFVAIGFTFCAVARGADLTLANVLRRDYGNWLYVPVLLPAMVINVGLAALMTLAIWEFYKQILLLTTGSAQHAGDNTEAMA